MTAAKPVILSPIERMMGIEFVSDPRGSRYPLPPIPEGHNMAYPYHVGADEHEITPKAAQDWVTHRLIRRDRTPSALLHDEFVDNRQILLSSVRTWTTRIERGELNPFIKDGIAFTPDGFILDGQHRLLGCIRANKPIRLPIVVNTPWSTFRDTDAGTARTAAQMLGSDYPEPQASAAASRMIFTVLAGDERTTHAVSTAARMDQLDLIKSWPFFRDKNTFTLMSEARTATGIQLSHLVGVCAMAHAALTVLGDDYPGDGIFEVDAFVRGLTFRNPHDYENWGTGSDPRYLLRTQGPRRSQGTEGMTGHNQSAASQRASISLVRRAMGLWLSRHNPRDRVPLTKLVQPKNNQLWPVWRSDLVKEYAAERQRVLAATVKKG